MDEEMEAALDARAIDILRRNDRGGYTLPNASVYPFQWNWDSAFVALGFAANDMDRAWREIETLFEGQWEDGFLPHIIFWQDDPGYFPGPSVWQAHENPATSGITQPPVAASVVRWLTEMRESAAEEPLRRLFPKLLAWHRWFHEVRDPWGTGLVLATHPWETGRDNAPEWDTPAAAVDISGVEPYRRRDVAKLDHSMRPTQDDYDRYVAILQYGRETGWDHRKIALISPFRVIDVGMTMILLRADRDLATLARRIGETQAAGYLERRVALAEAGAERLWNEEVGAYCSYDLVSERSLPALTNTSFLAFYGGVVNEARRARLLAHLDRIDRHVDYLLPSLDPSDSAFDAIRYWRGPVWAIMNYLGACGLAEAGHADWAERIRQDTRKLITGSGFFEAFCPLTGRGTGGNNFSWTAAMWLHWAGRPEGKP